MNPGPMSPGDSADTIAAYTSACAFFGERLATVTDLDWERPTPCEGWDVRMLVAHVVAGEALVAQVLGGGGSWDADVDPSVLGFNPMAAWRGTAVAAWTPPPVTGCWTRSTHTQWATCPVG